MQVQSPHFVVLSDSSEKQARKIAGQFERMRSVFHSGFPNANVDPASPILILAMKDKKGFQTLEPPSYLAKGQLDLAGLFLHAQDKNYVLLRLDAPGEHPYASIYHEYTHLLMADTMEWLPLWVNEGLAEFFQNTDIHEKEVDLGQASADDIALLRQNQLIPLETLFTVDAKSPYYHEDQKGSIFYAESWALTHFLFLNDRSTPTHLHRYLDMVSQHVDSVTAGERTFGDLHQLQKALQAYISRNNFQFFKVSAPADINETAYSSIELPVPAANAIRADFLAHNDRGDDAKALLESVLREDPKNAAAHETMGFLEFHQGHLEAARTWFEQAVQLDSQSYLAHYFYAAISLQVSTPVRPEDIEQSLKTSIHLNPKFAPAYDQLASFYGTHHEKLEEAHALNLRAVQLDPASLDYRLNAASVLQEANRYADAIRVLKSAKGVAKTPEEAASVENRITTLERYSAQRDEAASANGQSRAVASASAVTTRPGATQPAPRHPSEEPNGPKHIAKGVIKNVRCTDPSVIQLNVEGAGKAISLYSNNYFNIHYSATNYTPDNEIHPCTDLEGMKASVQYAESSDKTVDGQILSVELSR
ncbi:hypothetical protein ACPOL_1639 [Acidisarcina polymorpha]|uniref:DUF1570 domain-containing protein n=1 Tax=Acidisarcina polymorpha TaxID=2211140 RepID=A0A2Z5FX75_9BACT|nr:hypothetical protein ACPOL_1639 [Acidisarcina polymorpha]